MSKSIIHVFGQGLGDESSLIGLELKLFQVPLITSTFD